KTLEVNGDDSGELQCKRRQRAVHHGSASHAGSDRFVKLRANVEPGATRNELERTGTCGLNCRRPREPRSDLAWRSGSRRYLLGHDLGRIGAQAGAAVNKIHELDRAEEQRRIRREEIGGVEFANGCIVWLPCERTKSP